MTTLLTSPQPGLSPQPARFLGPSRCPLRPGGRAGAGGHLWAATALARTLQPRDARGRPCVDGSLGDLKRARTPGPQSRPRARSRRHRCSYGNCCARCRAPGGPQGQRSSRWLQTPRVMAARTRRFRRIAPRGPSSRGRGARGAAGAGGSGSGSHPEEDHASPSYPRPADSEPRCGPNT